MVPLVWAIPNRNVTPTKIMNKLVGNIRMTAAPVMLPKRPATIMANPMDRNPTFRSSFTQLMATTITRATMDAIAAVENSM